MGIFDRFKNSSYSKNFKYLDDLIHSGVKEILLDFDIVIGLLEEFNYGHGIDLDVDDLVIDGNGHTIDAKGKRRIFHCIGKNITIKNITLKNGFSIGGGGAIHNNGELTITESTITENTADIGGAIHNSGELTITESALNNNTAQGNGGAIHNDYTGKLTITESTLTGNTAQDYGGVIHNNKGDFKIFNCKFSNNKSPNNIILNNDSLQIHNTIFKDNQSKFIVLNESDGANLGIFNGEFKENNVEKSILYNNGKFCSVKNTVFQNNISNNTINIINNSELTLINPKIKVKGKSILNQNYILIRNSPPEIENTICGEGTVEVDEQIIPQGENFDFVYLDKKIHESNTKEISLDHDITFENYESDFYEGGIELDRGDLIINGNGHTIDGADKSRIFIITGKNITLKNIIFKNGHSHKNYDNPLNNNGGAIKINHNNNITIENCEFINNTSEENGGAIHNAEGSEIIITESTLTENTADMGGAIHNAEGSEIIITESTLTENTAKYSGGAIENARGELIITESTLTENTAKFAGGAIENARGELTITESTLIENTADTGGAIRNYKEKSFNIKNCKLENNKPNDVSYD